jgi:hypothetical protein
MSPDALGWLVGLHAIEGGIITCGAFSHGLKVLRVRNLHWFCKTLGHMYGNGRTGNRGFSFVVNSTFVSGQIDFESLMAPVMEMQNCRRRQIWH